MPYNVFISWSEENSTSHNVALLLKKWISRIIQTATCYVSSVDIRAGEVWLSNLLKNLADSKCGVVCLTQDSLNKPWIIFEAGALVVKFEKSRVIPLLIGIEKDYILSPLNILQCKLANRDGLWDIIKCVNDSSDLFIVPEETLRDAFDTNWPRFEKELHAIINSSPSKSPPKKRSTEEKIDDLLGLVRSLQQSVTRDEFTNHTQEALFSRVQDCELYNVLISRISNKRPLLLSWLNDNVIARSTSRGILNIYFPQEERHCYESLSRDNQLNFLNATIKEIGASKVNLFLLPE